MNCACEFVRVNLGEIRQEIKFRRPCDVAIASREIHRELTFLCFFGVMVSALIRRQELRSWFCFTVCEMQAAN